METFLAIYICLGGPSCPKVHIAGTVSYHSEASCATDARVIAQGMFVMSGNRYGFKCKRVDYEPPNLTNAP